MAKGDAISQVISVGNGQPVKMLLGYVSDAEYCGTEWVEGNGDRMKEQELPPDSHYTRFNLNWMGGSQRIKLAPVQKDRTALLAEGVPVMVIVPMRSKNGQLRDVHDRVEVVGVGLSRYDEILGPVLLDVLQ